jgi:hypothetical protein
MRTTTQLVCNAHPDLKNLYAEYLDLTRRGLQRLIAYHELVAARARAGAGAIVREADYLDGMQHDPRALCRALADDMDELRAVPS